MAIEIFISYAHADETLMQQLRNHLNPFLRTHLIDILWYDRDISAGKEWQREVDQHLNTAQIILLLISPDFIASDYCYSVEMRRALERHARGEARVIPVILRPVYWEEMLGELQPLPKDGKPVTGWHDIDDALLNVARGIRKATEEATIQALTRKISLFGYETDDGTNSVFWKNPDKFSWESHKRDYEAWWGMKRNLVEAQIVNQTWIKVSSYGDYWSVRFLRGGYLKEGLLSDPANQWEGSWKIIDGMLRINMGEYEMDIFGNRENPTYSAIEFEGGGKEAFAYHVFFPTEEDKAIMHWRNLNDVSHLIDQICEQVLNREARPIDLLLFGSLLHRGEKSVRDVVKLIGLSPDYRRRFISGRTTDEAIGLCYEHFLSRKADGGGKSHYINKVKKTGFDAIIAELIDSTEYKEEFGEDDVPVKYWLETSIETIRIRLTSPVPMATVHQSPILARGRVEGLPPSGRYFIVGYIITDVEYEQERASINKDGSWVIDHIHLGSTSHRLFFRIIDENKKLIAESKEITIFRR